MKNTEKGEACDRKVTSSTTHIHVAILKTINRLTSGRGLGQWVKCAENWVTSKTGLS